MSELELVFEGVHHQEDDSLEDAIIYPYDGKRIRVYVEVLD